MTRPALAVYTRDPQTGSMKELPSGRLTTYAFAGDLAARRPLRVLVADAQEPKLRITIQQLGEAWPFARDLMVEGAGSGAEVMEKVRRSAYALVLLDGNMPYLEGPHLLPAIRAQGVRVPVVVISAKLRGTVASNVEAFGAAFVDKRELNSIRLLNAMAAAILLPQRKFNHFDGVPFRLRQPAPVSVVRTQCAPRSVPLPVTPTSPAADRPTLVAVQVTPRCQPSLTSRMRISKRTPASVTGLTPLSRSLGGS